MWYIQDMIQKNQILSIFKLLSYREAAVCLSPSKRCQTATDDHDFDFTDDPNLVLGLSSLNLTDTGEGHNLHAKIKAYFLDTHRMSSSILFWQVRHF